MNERIKAIVGTLWLSLGFILLGAGMVAPLGCDYTERDGMQSGSAPSAPPTTITRADVSCVDSEVVARAAYIPGDDGGVVLGVLKVFPRNADIEIGTVTMNPMPGDAVVGVGDLGFSCGGGTFWICLYPANVCVSGDVGSGS